MRSEPRKFYSDGLLLDAKLYIPDDAIAGGEARPLVVACSGFTGMMNIHPERFARYLTSRGFLCFGFDYRGWGRSEGTRLRPLIEEQVRDIRSAVSAAMASSGVDRGKVFLLGWAMGGGMVLDAVRELPGLRGIASINGLYDGVLFQRAHRGDVGLAEFRRRIADERCQRAISGRAEFVDPFDIYPLDPVTAEYVRQSLEPVEGYDSKLCSFEFAESLLRWSILPFASALDLPLFVAHGDRNELHEPRQAELLEKQYGRQVDIMWLKGAGHTEWMHDDHPTYQRLCDGLYKWLVAKMA